MSCLQDEPTNHLDLPSILWLQGYLKTLEDKTVVLVSHDRAFLDETAQEIILLRHNRLAYHTGRHSHTKAGKVQMSIGAQTLRCWSHHALATLELPVICFDTCAGNYSEYERNAQEKQQHMLRLQEGIDRKKAHMEKSIQAS